MSRRYRLNNAWRAALPDLGLAPAPLLRRAGLPADLFRRPDPLVTADEYFRLVEAFADEADAPQLGLRIGQALTIDVFDPSLFAASCSPSLEVAVERVATYKRLMGPFRLAVSREEGALRVEFLCLDRPRLPPLLGMVDVTFSVAWARHATRTHIVPARVGLPVLAEDLAPHAAFFGVQPVRDERFSLVFREEDATRPFVTENPGMWRSFEPELRRRLTRLDSDASSTERVRAALLELLPSGRTRRGDVARSLGLGERTLQRRLRGEGTSYQAVLARTREAVARHYLERTNLTQAEIAFLLGFEDPNSFNRAFHQWTGVTPESLRTG